MTPPTARMRAIIQRGYGTPGEVLAMSDAPKPVPGAGQVLVEVRATSVNTPDWISVTGEPYILRLRSGLRQPTQSIRGSDVAGTVEAVGSGVVDLRPGDEVFGSLWDSAVQQPSGTFAEYAVVPAAQLLKKPAELSFQEAAASVMTGLTALTAMRDVGKVGPDTRVLINGASGGVGTMAVQIAKHLGARVTAVASGRNVAMLRSLGADEVIAYTTEDFTRSRRRWDVILDNVMNHAPSSTVRVLEPGGTFIPNSVGNSGGLFAGLLRMARASLIRKKSVNVRLVKLDVSRDNLAALAELLASREIRVVIDRAYPLHEAATAVAHMLGHRARGKVALTVDGVTPVAGAMTWL